jgi:NADH-quinone oxidoreductase subunit C
MIIDNAYLLEVLTQKFGNEIQNAQTPYNLLTIDIPAPKNLEVMDYLYHHPELQMTFMTDLCGVHLPDNAPEKEFCVVYHLHSLINNIRLRLKCYIAKDAALPSLTPLFATANWQERETYDFFGIIFANHPDLRRILNIDAMDYHPLRKEYGLEDETRTDKDDRYFGRTGNEAVKF